MIDAVDDQTNAPAEISPALQTAIFQTIPDGLIITDTRGRVILRNRAAQAYFSDRDQTLQAEEWPTALGFYLDDGKTCFPGERMPLVRALQGETPQAEEMIWRGGEAAIERWVSISARGLDDESGKPGGVMVLIQDITERKRMELAREKLAKRNEALYKFSRAISEAGNNLAQIAAVAATHTAEWLGDASVVSLTTPGSQELRLAAHHHLLPENRALLRRCLLTARPHAETTLLGGVLRSGEPLFIPSLQPTQLEMVTIQELRPYIREYGVHSLLVAPMVANNKVMGAISLARDRDSKAFTIDDQNFLLDLCNRTALSIENSRLFTSLRAEIDKWLHAKEALDTSEERFRAIFEATSLGIKVLDLDGNILQTNTAFQAMLGYASADVIGVPFHQLLYVRDAPRALRLLRDLLSSGTPDFRFEHRIRHREGHLVWAKTTFTAVKKGGGSPELAFLVGIVEDISEQKRIEANLAEMKSRLHSNVERERLHLAQELHDGPMQELYSAIYQIEAMRSQPGSVSEEALQSIKNGLQTILGELRSVASELRPPSITNFGLEKAIRSYVAEYREKHPEYDIHLALAQDHQFLPEDMRLALFRILQQSLMNVVRHAEASQINVRFTFDAEEAQLEIRDDGKGFVVPASLVELTRGGHFGLAGAAERVEALGGRLEIRSRPGDGTQVLAAIPLQAPNLSET